VVKPVRIHHCRALKKLMQKTEAQEVDKQNELKSLKNFKREKWLGKGAAGEV
jgi:hypothetical protein